MGDDSKPNVAENIPNDSYFAIILDEIINSKQKFDIKAAFYLRPAFFFTFYFITYLLFLLF